MGALRVAILVIAAGCGLARLVAIVGFCVLW